MPTLSARQGRFKNRLECGQNGQTKANNIIVRNEQGRVEMGLKIVVGDSFHMTVHGPFLVRPRQR